VDGEKTATLLVVMCSSLALSARGGQLRVTLRAVGRIDDGSDRERLSSSRSDDGRRDQSARTQEITDVEGRLRDARRARPRGERLRADALLLYLVLPKGKRAAARLAARTDTVEMTPFPVDADVARIVIHDGA